MPHPVHTISRAEARLVVLLARQERSKIPSSIRTLIRGRRTPSRIAEIILHCALLVGIPATLDALDTLRRMTKGPLLGGTARNATRGQRTFRRIYGSQASAVLRRLRQVDPFVETWIIDCAYGAVFSRPGLPLQSREVLTTIVLALQDLPIQFVSHARGALRQGVDASELDHWLHVAERLAGIDLSDQRAVVWHLNAQ